MKSTPIIKIRPIRIHFNLDTDRDGILDRRDCQPFNPFKHRITPSQETRKRLEKVPIYVTDEPIYLSLERGVKISPETTGFKGVHQIATKEARKYAPIATKDVYATIKQYPSVLGQIERSKAKQIVYSSRTPDVKKQILGLQIGKTVAVRPPQAYDVTPERKEEFLKEELEEETKKVSPKTRKQLVEEELERQQPYSYEPFPVQQKKVIRSVAGTTTHELMHEKQERDEGGAFSISEETEYKDYPWEKQARLASLKQMKKYEPSKPPTGKQISKILELED